MKYNLSNIEIFDINGKKTEIKIVKLIGELLYYQARNLDLVDIGMKINRGEEVELRDADIAEIKRIINDPEREVFAFVRKALNDYFTNYKESKDGKDK